MSALAPFPVPSNLPEELNSDAEVLPPPTNPMQVAHRFIAARYHSNHTLVLRHWRGGWWRWRKSHWAEVEQPVVRRAAYRFTEHAVYKRMRNGILEVVPWAPNRRKVGDLLEAVQAITYLDNAVQPPAWIDGTEGPTPGEVVACLNGRLHVGPRKLRSHDPTFFNQVAVPFDYAAAAPPPTRWLVFLSELWAGDPESIDALQEFFGYVISGRTDLHKILLLVGPTRAGKGVIARVLKSLVGRANVTGPTLASMATNFGLQDLINKPLAIISDARLAKADTNHVVERLLSVSGEDTLTIDRKYRDPWTGQLGTRFMLISNELPRFGDASGAIANRFVLLALSESWLGRENPALTDQLMAELPGILNWSLDGLDRLILTNRFTEPDSSADAIVALHDLVSPVAAFVRDRCTNNASLEVACDELYEAWKSWADDNGHRPGSVQTFGRDLRAVVPGLRTVRPRVDDDRERHFKGLALCKAHIAPGRGPARTNGASDAAVRAGPRPNVLSAQLADATPEPSVRAPEANPQCDRCHRVESPDNIILVDGRYLHRDAAACRPNGEGIDPNSVEGRFFRSIGELD